MASEPSALAALCAGPGRMLHKGNLGLEAGLLLAGGSCMRSSASASGIVSASVSATLWWIRRMTFYLISLPLSRRGGLSGMSCIACCLRD